MLGFYLACRYCCQWVFSLFVMINVVSAVNIPSFNRTGGDIFIVVFDWGGMGFVVAGGYIKL
jgi:hypothetical protein